MFLYNCNAVKALCLTWIMSLGGGLANSFKLPAFLRTQSGKEIQVPSQLKADDFLLMPQMMTTMSRVTKGLPVEYKPVTMIVGTKKEMDLLKEEFKLPMDFPVDPNAPDDQVVSVPLTLNQIQTSSSGRHPKHPTSSSMGGKQPVNGSCGVTLEDLLPLLRTHPIPTIVHDQPQMILNMLRTLVGPKPDGTKSKLEPLDSADVPANIQKLVSLATKNPELVKMLAKFDSQFIPNLVNAILGLDEDSTTEEESTADEEETTETSTTETSS